MSRQTFITGLLSASLTPSVNPNASLAKIMVDVASEYGVAVPDIVGKSREHYLIPARQEFMRRANATGKFRLKQIGGMLGGRDHSTILHGIRRANERLNNGTA